MNRHCSLIRLHQLKWKRNDATIYSFVEFTLDRPARNLSRFGEFSVWTVHSSGLPRIQSRVENRGKKITKWSSVSSAKNTFVLCEYETGILAQTMAIFSMPLFRGSKWRYLNAGNSVCKQTLCLGFNLHGLLTIDLEFIKTIYKRCSLTCWDAHWFTLDGDHH